MINKIFEVIGTILYVYVHNLIITINRVVHTDITDPPNCS